MQVHRQLVCGAVDSARARRSWLMKLFIGAVFIASARPASAVTTVNIGMFPDGTTVPPDEVITDQYRDIGILFSGRLGISDFDPISLIIFGSGPNPDDRYLFNSPDLFGVVYQFDFVEPGTDTPTTASFFQIGADFDAASESLDLVGLDGDSKVVASLHVTPGEFGFAALVGINAPEDTGFSRVEVRTMGNPGIGFLGTHPLGLQFDIGTCPLPADIDNDGVVGVSDLLALLTAWGDCPAPPGDCPADLDCSGSVNTTDLLMVLANWG